MTRPISRGAVPGALRVLTALVVIGHPASVFADNVDGSATTLVDGMKDLRDGQVYSVVPVIEMVSLNARDIQAPGVSDLSFVMSGWGAYQFGDTLAQPGVAPGSGGDLSLAYVQGTELNQHLTLRLGRQDVIGGAAQVLPIDGASVTLSPWKTAGISAYGGALVVPRFATAIGDAAAGTRIFWHPTYESEVGASFVDVLNHGLAERQEVGVDARWVPVRWLTFTGYALASTLDDWRLAEGEASVSWQPIRDLQVVADYHRTAPDLFISAASIFSVFAEEREDEVGGSAFYRLTRWIASTGTSTSSIRKRAGAIEPQSGQTSTSARGPLEFRVRSLPCSSHPQALQLPSCL